MFSHSTPVPTEEDFNYVHPSPPNVIEPKLKLDQIYHLVMKEKLWKSWSGDSFGIYYSGDQRPFEVDVKGVSLTFRDKMMIRDQEGKVLAVLLKMHFRMETTFKLYGFTPYIEGQSPSAEQKHEDQPLYQWAEIKDKFFSVRKTMTTVDGIEYVSDGVGKVFDLNQLRITRDGKPCAHCRQINMGIFKGNQWDIRTGVGIDPCMIVGFMAILDEMNEDK